MELKKKNSLSKEVVEENIETGLETGQEGFAEAPADIEQSFVSATEEPAGTVLSTEENVNEDLAETVSADLANVADSETATSSEVEAQEEVQEEAPTKKGLFARLKEGLKKTRNNIVSGMDSLFSSEGKIDEDFYEELEEILILGDIGVHTTENILDKLRSHVKENHIKKRDECKEFLINTIKEEMAGCESCL